jgi:group I intron endonuclease
MSTTKSGIYKITNLVNNKIYIGSAFNLSNRISCHKYTLKNNKHKNKHLQAAYNLYGEKNFLFEVIEIVEDLNILIIREQYYLDILNPTDKNIGYNIAKKAGNTAGVLASPNTRIKQSESAKKRPKRLLTEEQKRNISLRFRGKTTPWSKLNWDIVKNIRYLYESGKSQLEISKVYSIAQTTVSEIIRNIIWFDQNYTYIRRRNGKK